VPSVSWGVLGLELGALTRDDADDLLGAPLWRREAEAL
jgi:hypothetical protein